MSYRDEIDDYDTDFELSDENDQPNVPSRAFSYRCAMGVLEVDTPLTLAKVRRARAEHKPLTVRLPAATLLESGPNKGIRIGGSAPLDVELTFPWDADAFWDDKLPGVGRVFPMQYRGDHDEHPTLQFLVFDSTRELWFLSCGGLEYCWWCKSDREFEVQMRDTGFDLTRYDCDDDYYS